MISLAVSASAWCAATLINESTGFSLGVIFAVFGGIWWLGRKLQHMEDSLSAAQSWREEVKEQLAKSDSERLEIIQMIAGLPCNRTTICELKKHKDK